MPRVPWEQRRDKLSGALWVIPVLFMAGAIAVGGLLSLINIGPDSAIAPLLFRGNGQVAVPAGGQLKVPTPRVDHFLFRVVPPRARAWRMR